MTKCPFCHFDNEDGAIFCEQCKSDLSVTSGEPVAAAPGVPALSDHPVAAIPVEETPPPVVPQVAPVVLEAIPMPAVDSSSLPVAAEVAVAVAPPPPLPEVVPAKETAPRSLTPPAAVSTPVSAAVKESPVAPSAAPATPAPAPGQALPAGAQPRLLVLRGQKRNVEYPLYDGLNFVGRADDKPVDIDLEDQEPPDRVWCSRQHCCISFDSGKLELEDLNSANGTYVNRQRIYPGQKQEIHISDIIQIGNVQLKVIV